MECPMDYEGPVLEIIHREIKPDNTPEVLTQLFQHLESSGSRKTVGIYQKDPSDGPLTEQVLSIVERQGMKKVEMKDFMDKVHMVKIDQEVKNMKVAGGLVNWTFTELINEVEDIIDGEKQVKHAHIQKKVEGMLEKENLLQNFLKKH